MANLIPSLAHGWLLGRGSKHYKQKKFHKAVECFSKSLEHAFSNETRANSYLWLACSFEKAGDLETALEYAETGFKLFSQSDLEVESVKKLHTQFEKYLQALKEKDKHSE
jgi:tetratricopeptide (TPR) repeat protein